MQIYKHMCVFLSERVCSQGHRGRSRRGPTYFPCIGIVAMVTSHFLGMAWYFLWQVTMVTEYSNWRRNYNIMGHLVRIVETHKYLFSYYLLRKMLMLIFSKNWTPTPITFPCSLFSLWLAIVSIARYCPQLGINFDTTPLFDITRTG